MVVEILPAFVNNYFFLLQFDGLVGVVDPGDENVVKNRLTALNLELNFILCTHHHNDHIGGVLGLKKKYPQCIVYGYTSDRKRLPGLDVELSDNDIFTLGVTNFKVIATPGHTVGAICYYCQSSEIVFVGDTLFSLGCGRLFEGTAEQMYTSLARLKELPPQTKVYCAHEYTSDNALFLKNLGNLNFDQKLFLDEVSLKRAQKSPTVPTYLADELKCNPFLLAKSAEEFAKIRILKDNFKAV